MPLERQIQLNYVLCIERTGSSMLSAMFNSHPDLLSPSEEPFALYLYHHCRNKRRYSDQEIDFLIHYFKRTSEKNLELYFSPISDLKEALLLEKDNLPFEKLCQIIYLHFIPLKPKETISQIIDKQIKYILNIDLLISMFPECKIVILIRDYHDVIASWRKRGLASGRDVAYIAEIWNLSYKNAKKALCKYPEKIRLIRYEDLVTSPNEKLKEIASFFGFEYHEMMIDHHKNFTEYIDQMRDKVSADFIKRLEEFHSNTLSPVTNELIGDWKNRLTTSEISVIENICGNTGKFFGYEPTLPETSLSFRDKKAIALARFNKLVYLDIYVNIPLVVKSLIKKFRPNKIQE